MSEPRLPLTSQMQDVLRREKDQRGLTLSALAFDAGLNPATLSRILSGHRASISASTLRAITTVLGLSTDSILPQLVLSPAEEAAAALPDQLPVLLMQAVIERGESTDEGVFVQAVTVPWFRIVELLSRDPSAMYEFDWRRWEEIVAAAYHEQGFEVILTPRSGDAGRDIIASSKGFGSIRILDQVKCYKPGHVVSADEVRQMLGVLAANDNASKGVITTTSHFAPRLLDDPGIRKFVPFRLELKPKESLLEWLVQAARIRHPGRPSASAT